MQPRVVHLQGKLKEELFTNTTDRVVVAHVQRSINEKKKELGDLFVSVFSLNQFLGLLQSSNLSNSGSVDNSFENLRNSDPTPVRKTTQENAALPLSSSSTLPSNEKEKSKGFKLKLPAFSTSKSDLTVNTSKSESNLNSGDVSPRSPRNRLSNSTIISMLRKKLVIVKDLPYLVRKQLVEFIDRMRNDPQLLSQVLCSSGFYKGKQVNATTSKRLGHVIVSSLFRNCFTIREEALFLHFIESVIDTMKDTGCLNKKGGSTFPLFFQDLIIAYIKNSRVNEYLSSILQDILTHYIHTETFNTNTTTTGKEDLIDKVLERITSSVASLPYGIKFIAHKLYKVGMELEWTELEIFSVFLHDLLLNTYFIPCLLSPDVYASIHTGLDTSNDALVKMSQIANQFRRMSVESDSRLASYFRQIIAMPILADYGCRSEHDMAINPYMYIKKSDLDMLLKLLAFHQLNADEKLFPVADDIAVGDERGSNGGGVGEYRGLDGDVLLVLNIEIDPVPVPKQPKAEIEKGEATAKEVKKKLLSLLTTMSPLLGVHTEDNLLTVLESQHQYWSKDSSSLLAQTYEIMRCINELPPKYQENNYQLIFDQMITECEARMSLAAQYKVKLMVQLDCLQTAIIKISRQKSMLLQYCTKLRLSHFKIDTFFEERDKFILRFNEKFFTKQMSCYCSVLGNSTCEGCRLKSNEIKTFMSDIDKRLREYWRTENYDNPNEEEEINAGIKQLEQNLLGILHDRIFVGTSEDIVLSSKMKVSNDIQPKDFHIPEKFQPDAPWPFAQNELTKINYYKAPYDKFLCISNCWEIIHNCISMIDEAGPDALWPIMAYVLLRAGLCNLLSNILYISLYTTLTEEEDARLQALKTAVQVLMEIIQDQASNFIK